MNRLTAYVIAMGILSLIIAALIALGVPDGWVIVLTVLDVLILIGLRVAIMLSPVERGTTNTTTRRSA